MMLELLILENCPWLLQLSEFLSLAHRLCHRSCRHGNVSNICFGKFFTHPLIQPIDVGAVDSLVFLCVCVIITSTKQPINHLTNKLESSRRFQCLTKELRALNSFATLMLLDQKGDAFGADAGDVGLSVG